MSEYAEQPPAAGEGHGDTLARIVAHGGEIITSPFPEGLLTVATFRDPAGNVIGLWHDTTR